MNIIPGGDWHEFDNHEVVVQFVADLCAAYAIIDRASGALFDSALAEDHPVGTKRRTTQPVPDPPGLDDTRSSSSSAPPQSQRAKITGVELRPNAMAVTGSATLNPNDRLKRHMEKLLAESNKQLREQRLLSVESLLLCRITTGGYAVETFASPSFDQLRSSQEFHAVLTQHLYDRASFTPIADGRTRRGSTSHS